MALKDNQLKYFGTDGVRGLVGQHPLVPEFVSQLGYAAGKVLSRQTPHPLFLIGRDTRQSGKMLQNALTAGLTASGASVIDLGVIPTPGVAFLVKQIKAKAGVVISASHNPANQNGIKIFNEYALKLSKDVETEIESLLDKPLFLNNNQTNNFDQLINGADLRKQYLDYLVNEHQGLNLHGLKLVVDCANGAASSYGYEVFTRLGADVIPINATPDGTNINVKAGSEYVRQYPGRLSEIIRANNANFGIAFDGDADRVIFVDEVGNLVDGDQMLAILGDYLHAQGKLLGNIVVSTTMRNGALVNYFAERKIKFIETPVGDKYIVKALHELELNEPDNSSIGLGGEQSGHIILMDQGHTTGDGLRSAVYLIKAYLASGENSLSKLAESIHKFPQVIASAQVAEKINLDQLETVVALQNEIKRDLPGLTRMNLRYSGTEPLVRLMLEADHRHNEADLAKKAYKLCDAIQKETRTPSGSLLEVLNVTRGGLVARS